MNQEQKERLEQELRFLKESLEADVISKDEYERGRERIERKLKEIEEKEEPFELEEKEEELIKEKLEEEVKEEPRIEIKEIKEEKPKRIEVIEEEKEEEEVEEKPEEAEKPEEEEITISKKWLYGIAILLIAFVLFFSIRSCKKPTEQGPIGATITEEPVEELIPECSSNSDCKQEGMIGVCINPGTKEAKCKFKEDITTNLIIINDKNCKLCDSSGMKKIIKVIFPNVKISELDYQTAEAKKLVDKFNINALPAYIFDLNISKATNFDDFKTALIKKEDGYIMTNTASGASYYFRRPLIKNQLDLYVLPETTEKIEASMQEVLDLFKVKINFTKHLVTEIQKETLKKDLAINTYPTFLLNNQLKFGGILPANMIKERMCDVNYFEECSKELSKI